MLRGWKLAICVAALAAAGLAVPAAQADAARIDHVVDGPDKPASESKVEAG